MGQIIGSAAKPKRCNLQSLSSLGTPAAGEYILVSSDNSMNAAGQGNFDCYIVGNGSKAATALSLKYFANGAIALGDNNPISGGTLYNVLNGKEYDDVDINTLTEMPKSPLADRWGNTTTAAHVVIPLDGVTKIEITGRSGGYCYWTLLKSYDATDFSSAPDYATGYTSTIGIRADKSATIPSSNPNYPLSSDAHYLLILTKYNNNECKPTRVRIWKPEDGILDRLEDAEEAIERLESQETDADIHDTFSNFVKVDEWIANKYINGSGVETNGNGLYASGKIYVDEYHKYYRQGFYEGYYAFYRADDSVIEAHGQNDNSPNPFTPPAGTSYVRFTATSLENAQGAWVGIDDLKPKAFTEILLKRGLNPLNSDAPCDYQGDDVSVFTKCLCVGDSLTMGVFNTKNATYLPDNTAESKARYAKFSYPTYFQKITGVETTNKGDSGATSVAWYNTHQNDDLSGHDMAIIQLGVNDALTLGGWTANSITAFTNIITKLKNDNNKIKIFVATIMPAYSYQQTTIAEVSEGIRTLVASLNDPDVILVDLAKYGHTLDSRAYNCGHLSAYGYLRLAMDYKAYIGYYMQFNKLTFREVQFIGTNESYT